RRQAAPGPGTDRDCTALLVRNEPGRDRREDRPGRGERRQDRSAGAFRAQAKTWLLAEVLHCKPDLPDLGPGPARHPDRQVILVRHAPAALDRPGALDAGEEAAQARLVAAGDDEHTAVPVARSPEPVVV